MKPEEFKALRLKLGYTQTGIATRLGYRLRQIQRFEAGEAPLPVVLVMALRSLPSAKSFRRKNASHKANS